MISEQQAKDMYREYRQDKAADNYFVRALEDACAAHGATLEFEPEFHYVGRILFADGRVSYFRLNKFDINPHASCLTATDKTYTSFYLQRAGLRVPEGLSFFAERLNAVLQTKRTVDDACAYAAARGYPLIVKPNDMSQGTLVTRVHDEGELRAVVEEIFKLTNVAIVQPIYEGRDYRLVLLDNQLVAAYQRVPLQVVGNGQDSILRLLQQKQQAVVAAGRADVIKLDDSRMLAILKNQQLTMESVPTRGQTIRLLDNANLSTGGDAIDITAQVHESYVALARQSAQALNLRALGVDFIAPDLTQPAANDYVILEVNAAPGLRNYAALGPEAMARARNFYFKIVSILAGQKHDQ